MIVLFHCIYESCVGRLDVEAEIHYCIDIGAIGHILLRFRKGTLQSSSVLDQWVIAGVRGFDTICLQHR